MNEKTEYLPLGSLVQINGGKKLYVIISRGLQVKFEGEKLFFDYGACMYPEGLIGDQVAYFQHEDIQEVVFKGYSDRNDVEMVKAIQDVYEKQKLVKTDVKQMKVQRKN